MALAATNYMAPVVKNCQISILLGREITSIKSGNDKSAVGVRNWDALIASNFKECNSYQIVTSKFRSPSHEKRLLQLRFSSYLRNDHSHTV